MIQMIGFALLATWALAPGLKPDTPILTYHDVIEQRDAASLWFDCTVSELGSQLDWLIARGAHFVTVDQMYRHLAQGAALPHNAVMLTFADGYQGFFERGWPILKRRGIPAVMFVHTDYVGDQHGRPKMTWQELQELDRGGLVTIGSETRSHPLDVRKLSNTALTEEMAGSKLALERHLGHPVAYLAYPNGKFDERVARAAQHAGYSMAFTERLMPCEASPNLFMVARYVHTKYRQAWNDAHRLGTRASRPPRSPARASSA